MDPLRVVQDCVRHGRVEMADHAYDQLLERRIDPEDVIEGALQGTLVEDYRASRNEARILTLQAESGGGRLHVVWDLPWRDDEPAIFVTAYRPDRSQWHDDLMRRR